MRFKLSSRRKNFSTTMNHDNRSATNDSYYGRKRAILFLCVPLLAGWVTVLLSGGGFALLCAGRVLQGAGIMSSVTQVYLVEIADVKRRWVDADIGRKMEGKSI